MVDTVTLLVISPPPFVISSVVERSALPLGLSKKSPRMPYRSLHALRLVEMTWGLRLIVGYVVIIAAATS